jgi:hypothetical protein
MSTSVEYSKTLDELDPPAWGAPTYSSHLVKECHRLRKKRLVDFSSADLRILIGQEIGLLWLVPMALEVLKTEPLTESEFYPGDLLVQVLRLPQKFWSAHGAQRHRLESVLERGTVFSEDIQEDIVAFRQAVSS